MIRTNNYYLNNLIRALEEKGLTYEEVKTSYKYSGGRGSSDADPLYEYASDTRHSRYFDLCFPNEERPDKVESCLCNHSINENCYISKNFDINTILILGNCCIKKFIDKSSRTCEICSDTHKNRKVNYCNDCKKTNYKCIHCKIVNITTGKYCSDDCFEKHTYKKCTKCNLLCPYLNKNNRCSSCCKGFCLTCNKKIDQKYKKCYSCNLKK